jgi:hypothetical protein
LEKEGNRGGTGGVWWRRGKGRVAVGKEGAGARVWEELEARGARGGSRRRPRKEEDERGRGKDGSGAAR